MCGHGWYFSFATRCRERLATSLDDNFVTTAFRNCRASYAQIANQTPAFRDWFPADIVLLMVQREKREAIVNDDATGDAGWSEIV
jgi:hypothetical protein